MGTILLAGRLELRTRSKIIRLLPLLLLVSARCPLGNRCTVDRAAHNFARLATFTIDTFGPYSAQCEAARPALAVAVLLQWLCVLGRSGAHGNEQYVCDSEFMLAAYVCNLRWKICSSLCVFRLVWVCCLAAATAEAPGAYAVVVLCGSALHAQNCCSPNPSMGCAKLSVSTADSRFSRINVKISTGFEYLLLSVSLPLFLSAMKGSLSRSLKNHIHRVNFARSVYRARSQDVVVALPANRPHENAKALNCHFIHEHRGRSYSPANFPFGPRFVFLFSASIKWLLIIT